MGQLKDQIYLEDEQLYEQIDTAIRQKGKETYLPLKERLWLRNSLYDSFRRLDILQELLDDKDVTEIMINGAGKIFIEKKGNMVLWNRRFEKTEQLEDIIQQIVGKVNRIVNVSSPIADARLEDGSRVHIVLPPVALDGPVVTIRKFPDPITIEKLIRFQALTEEAAQFLEQLVKAKYNLFVCGGTNSGKTTFLNALSSFIPETERVITIEDSAELQITHVPNLVRLETRNANTEGEGEITISQLIKASLRMNPSPLRMKKRTNEREANRSPSLHAYSQMQTLIFLSLGIAFLGHLDVARKIRSRSHLVSLQACCLHPTQELLCLIRCCRRECSGQYPCLALCFCCVLYLCHFLILSFSDTLCLKIRFSHHRRYTAISRHSPWCNSHNSAPLLP
ncbi:MAG: CpaF family protein [Clostridium sp.]|nr:CpaF family protein [Clostridium sp.]